MTSSITSYAIPPESVLVDGSQSVGVESEVKDEASCLHVSHQVCERPRLDTRGTEFNPGHGATLTDLRVTSGRISEEGPLEFEKKVMAEKSAISDRQAGTQSAQVLVEEKATSSTNEEVNDNDITQERLEAGRTALQRRADRVPERNISVIENYATGDAVQIMVSTNGKIIRGQNRGMGRRTRQVGGYLSDATIVRLLENI